MQINWNNSRIPATWNPATLLSQWADILPTMTLPAGHVFTYPPSLASWTIAQIMSKGVTHWSKNWVVDERGGGETGVAAFRADAAYVKKEYNDIPRTREIFNLDPPVCVDFNPDGSCAAYSWWPNGYYNESQARAKGQSVSIAPRLWVGETEEGDDYVPENEPMWRFFYEELRARYEAQKSADGIPFFLTHNYFLRWGNPLYELRNGNDNYNNRLLLYGQPNTYDASIWKPGLYTPGGNLASTNTILQEIYVDSPNEQVNEVYQALFSMDVARMLGYHTGIVLFNRQEWLPGFSSRFHVSAGEGAHPNQSVPAGTFERSDKPPVDPNLILALPFLAHEFGEIFVNWGAGVKASTNPRAIFYNPQVHAGKDRFFPDSGGESAYPGYISPGSENGRRSSEQDAYLNDLVAFGIANWNTVAGPVAGGTWGYCDFRLDGGAWISAAANKSDVLVAWNQKRGFVRYRYNSSEMMIFYWNGFADNLVHSIEIRDPLSSVIHTGTVCGNGEHAFRFSIANPSENHNDFKASVIII